MHFSIATPWDDEFIRRIVALNQIYVSNRTIEVFGSFKSTIIGTGRPSYRLPEVTEEQAMQHITSCHQQGIRFNYLLNAPDFLDKEHDQKWIVQVREYIHDLISLGVDAFTIAHPLLIKIAKEESPETRVNVSLIAGTDTVEAAKRFEDMGVDVIILNPHTINRDFESIQVIRNAVACELELYANIPCIHQCPKAKDHYRLLGYLSQNTKDARSLHERKVIDPFIIGCSLVYLSNPVELLKSPFIRPEDVQVYEDMGVNVIKLSDRGESIAWLSQTLETYMDGEFDGNLFSLVFRNGAKFKAGIRMFHPEVVDWKIPIVIDNHKLSEIHFLDQIRSLAEMERESFYQYATQEAVTINHTPEVVELVRKLEQTEHITIYDKIHRGNRAIPNSNRQD